MANKSKKKKRAGFIDARGQLVIAPQFDEVDAFSGGTAAVRVGKKFGAVDRDGRLVVEPIYTERIGRFVEGRSLTCADGRYGYLGINGDWAIEPKFAHAGEFGSGIAPATEDRPDGDGCFRGKYGYLAPDGSWAIDPSFQSASAFRDGLAVVAVAGKSRNALPSEGVIDPKGRWVVAPTYVAAKLLPGALVGVCVKRAWGILDRKGNAVLPAKYTSVDRFGDHVLVERDDRLGVFGAQGWMIEPELTALEPFSDGMARATVDGSLAFVDTNGRVVKLGLDVDYLGDFSDGRALFSVFERRKKHYGFFDRQGKVAIAPAFADASVFSESLAWVKSSDRWSCIDPKGDVAFELDAALAPIAAPRFVESLVPVMRKRDKQWGFVDRAGGLAIPPQFASAEEFAEGRAAVEVG